MFSNAIIAIDFDGTIVKKVWPGMGEPIPGALEWIKKYIDAGARIILWTMRSGDELPPAIELLKENGIELWGVNLNPQQHGWTSSNKQYAHIYIDDTAYGCPLIYPAGGLPYVNWDIVGPGVMGLIG